MTPREQEFDLLCAALVRRSASILREIKEQNPATKPSPELVEASLACLMTEVVFNIAAAVRQTRPAWTKEMRESMVKTLAEVGVKNGLIMEEDPSP